MQECVSCRREILVGANNPCIVCVQKIEDFFRAQRAWSAKTFGPGYRRGPIGPLKHLAKEVNEAIEQAELARRLNAEMDLVGEGKAVARLHKEIADLQFLAWDAAWRSGMSAGQLAETCWKKLKENQERVWPPIPEGDGPLDEPVEHCREYDKADVAADEPATSSDATS